MSSDQLGVIDQFYPGDSPACRAHSSTSATASLFDDRRPPGNKVHMMDSSGRESPIGYHRWHAIIRAMTLLGIDADRWNAIDPLVALAWASTPRPSPDRTPRTRRYRRLGSKSCAPTGSTGPPTN